MNFKQANIVCKKYFGKPKEFGNKYLYPYSVYEKDIDYPIVFIISLHHNNEISVLIGDYGYVKNYINFFHSDYTKYSKEKFEKIIKNYKNVYKLLKENYKEQ